MSDFDDAIKTLKEATFFAAAPTNDATFDALVERSDYTTASLIYGAIIKGKIPNVMFHVKQCTPAISLLQEVQRRMVESQKQAADQHAAWNPAQVVTQLCLEIETGRYEVKL